MVCVCGCVGVGVWVCGCVGVWVCGCVGGLGAGKEVLTPSLSFSGRCLRMMCSTTRTSTSSLARMKRTKMPPTRPMI